MKILLVGDFPPPWGGVSVHVLALREAIRNGGARARVLDIGEGGRSGRRAPEVLASGGYLRFAGLLSAHAALGWTVHVHTSGANPRSWLLALAGAAAAGGRAVLTVHSGLAPGFLAGHPGGRLAARAAALGYASVLCSSQEVAAALTGAGVDEGRLRVAPAFAPQVVRPEDPPLPARAHRAFHRPLVCAAVAPGPTYGAEVLLDAFARLSARLPRAGLCLYGRGSDGAALVERARDLGLAGSVVLLGELSHGQALGVVSGADLFVRPTRAEGDALSVREALALGRRVVATRVGHRPEGVLLCRPDDPEDLAAAMARALQSPPPAPAREPGVDGVLAAIEAYRRIEDG